MEADMNSINNSWDSTKFSRNTYFHCTPSCQNEMKEKGKQREKKHENG